MSMPRDGGRAAVVLVLTIAAACLAACGHTQPGTRATTTTQTSRIAPAANAAPGVGPVAATWAHAPEWARLQADVLDQVTRRSSLAPRIRALVTLLALRATDCQDEWAPQATAARQLGLSDDLVDDLARGTAPHALPAELQPAYDVAAQLLRDHRVTQATFEAARGQLGEAGLVELVALLGTLYTVCDTANLLHTDSTFPRAPLPRAPLEHAAAIGPSTSAVRFPVLSPEDMSAAQRQMLDELVATRKQDADPEAGGKLLQRGVFNLWLRSPELGTRLQRVSAYLTAGPVIPSRLKQIVILTIARRWTAHYEWITHRRIASARGLSDDLLRQLGRGDRPTGMTEDEALVFDATTQLDARHRLDDALFARLHTRFGARGIVDLLAIVGLYTNVAMSLDLAEFNHPDLKDPLPPLPASTTP